MGKLIITAVICSAEVTKENNLAVPYTVEEMVRKAKGAYDAGAAVIHVYVRWNDGAPTQNREWLRVVPDAVRAACPGVILIPSTGDVTGIAPGERLRSTEFFPEAATLDCGICNFGNGIFVNDMPTMRAFGQRTIENHIELEYKCLEIDHLDTILNMTKKGLVLGTLMQSNFVLGVSGYTLAAVGNLNYLVKQVPFGSAWTVTGIGRSVWDAAAASIVMGDDVHVGFEDNIYLDKGHKAASSGELAAKVVRLSKELSRKITNPGEARGILSLA